MSINRRSFVRQFGATLGAASLGTTLFPALALGEGFENLDLMNIPPLDTPEDDFWAWVQQSYMVSPNIINWIGQIVPVKKIAAAAHQRGIDVLVDGAQSFALMDFKIPDLDCDYFATSLHKWLCAPFGSGLFSIDGYEPGDIDTYLFKNHKIHTVGIVWENISGGRPCGDIGYRGEMRS